MAKNTYEIIYYEGYKFFFKFEENPPDMLHIYARGCFYPRDAIEVWFNGSEERENFEHNRMETYTESLGIYWLWLDRDKQTKILIISCFKRTDNDETRTKR